MKTDEELRDYFAAQALAGLLAHRGADTRTPWSNTDIFAKYCYAMAASMLKARKEKTE